ncbi:MAG: GGDEF domain-containing protein [Acholeplasmataceae bacterium]|nr:GGDEF domain-containing protein [Acholeplasmataceae bacterium]
MTHSIYSEYVQHELDQRKSSSLTIFIYIAIALLLINAIFDIQTLPDQWYYVLIIRIMIVVIILFLLNLFKKNKVSHFTLLISQLTPIYLFMTIAPEIFVFDVAELNVVNFTAAFVVILFPSLINVVSLKQSALLSVLYMLLLLTAKLVFQTYSFSDWYLHGGGFIIMFSIIAPFVAHYRYQSLVKLILSKEEIILLNAKITELNTELIKKTELLKEQSTIDYLTKVYNRRGFLTLAQEYLCKDFIKERGIALYMIDVDDFKAVNDIYGHITGDDILLQMITSIKKAIREEDLLCRWGGEEFVMMASGVTKEEAFLFADEIKKIINKTSYTSKKVRITVTIGMVYTEENRDFDTLLHHADKALIHGKTHGKNQIVVEEL